MFSLQGPKRAPITTETSDHKSYFVRKIFPAALAAVALTLNPLNQPALAENVRVEDVESSTLRAGLVAANEGRLDAAERFFQMYLAQEDQSSASAHSNLGNVHLQMGRTQQALEDFTKSIELAPTAAVPHLNRSIVYEQLGVDEEGRGNTAAAQSYYLEAIADCDIAIAADPLEFAAWFDKGNVELRRKDFDGALISFNRAADLAPGLAGYRLRAGTLQYQTGDVTKALRTIKGVVRKNSRYGEARAALAAVQWDIGDTSAAEEQLAVALDIDAGVWGNEAGVMKNTRWPPKMLEAYSRLLKFK